METAPWKREVPSEIMVDIFSRLPLSSAIRLRCLSRQWLDTLREDNFWDLHAERSPESTLIVTVQVSSRDARTQGKPVIRMSCLEAGSKPTPPVHSIIRQSYMPCSTCNGLMCIRRANSFDTRPVLVCNPLTAEYIALPQCTTDGFLRCSVGLGYSPSSNKYKVACINGDCFIGTAWTGAMWVHTLGADAGWRKVHTDVDFQPQWRTSGGLCVDGKMYWVISGPLPRHGFRLLSFDVESEEVTRTAIDVPSLRFKCIDDGEFRLAPLGGRQVSMVVLTGLTGSIQEWVMLGDCTWRLGRRFDLHQYRGHFGRMLAVSRTSGEGDMLVMFEKMTLCIHNGRVGYTNTVPGPGYPPCEVHGQDEFLGWNACGGYQASLFSLESFGGGYAIQQGGIYVAWCPNLLSPPSRSSTMYCCQSMEPQSAANGNDGGTSGTSDNDDDMDIEETIDNDDGWTSEMDDNDEEQLPINHHNNPA